jgi:hypothetical protein
MHIEDIRAGVRHDSNEWASIDKVFNINFNVFSKNAASAFLAIVLLTSAFTLLPSLPSIGNFKSAFATEEKTLDDSEFDIRIAVISDTHIKSNINPSTKAFFDAILPDIANQHINFGVNVGDTIDATYGKVPEELESLQSNFINSTNTTFFLNYGDHGKDYGKHQTSYHVPEAIFGATFDTTNNAYGYKGKGWYFEQNLPYMWSMTYHNVHFVFLPSLFADDMVIAWLSKDLEDNKDYTTLIFAHFGSDFSRDGFADGTRAQFRSLFASNPQVIGFVSGHNHVGRTPVLLSGNAYQFWTDAPDVTRDSEWDDKRYLIYSLRTDGLYVFQRDADDNSTTLIWGESFQTSFLHQPKIHLSLPYLLRDKQKVSIPFPQIESPMLRVWGMNFSQLVESSTAPWNVNATGVSLEGVVSRKIGNENYNGQRFQAATISNAPVRWAYIDIFNQKDLRRETNVQYGIFMDILANPDMNIRRELVLINETSGKVIATGTNSYNTGDVFFDFLYHVQHGVVYATSGGGEVRNMSPSAFGNMTLRLWFGPAKNSANVTNIDVGVWVHDRSFVMAPVAGTGDFTTLKAEVTISGKTYKYENLGPLKSSSKVIDGNLKGDLSAKITGSRIALVELIGDSDPVLFFVNPRKSEVKQDETGNTIEIKDRLYSTSQTVVDTVLYSLRPALLGVTVLDKSDSVARLSSSDAKLKLTNILDIVNANLLSYKFTNDILSIGLNKATGANASTQIYIPRGAFGDDKFTVTVDAEQWGYDWDSTNRLLAVWAVTEQNSVSINVVRSD